MSVCYQIQVQGQLDSRWAYYFEGLEISLLATGETVLSGPLQDQAALYSVLSRIRDLGLPLLLVRRLSSTIEQPVQQEGEAEEKGE